MLTRSMSMLTGCVNMTPEIRRKFEAIPYPVLVRVCHRSCEFSDGVERHNDIVGMVAYSRKRETWHPLTFSFICAAAILNFLRKRIATSSYKKSINER